MRVAAVVPSLFLLLASSLVVAQPVRQSDKYTLLIVAGGTSDGTRRDGAAMAGTGVYFGREECEAAGAAVRTGVVNKVEGEKPPTIVWICVPLGRP